ncbi:MAG TPA: protein translocase subunit SecD [bacterium]|nr:protein translocase subunit SecD [bacterium]
MRGKLVARTVIIILLLLWALYALYPSLQLQMMKPEERNRLESEGKMDHLIRKAINLGLDLKGGMYLTLEVDLPNLIESLASNKDATFDTLMERTRQQMNIRSESYLMLLRQNFDEARIPLHRYWGERGDNNERIMTYLERQARDAMDVTLQKLTNRIDQFGVSEPTIQKVGGRRILIQLPGVTNPEQAKALIGKTAMLEWRMLKDPMIFTQTIERIDRTLARERGVAVTEPDPESEEPTHTAEAKPGDSEDAALSVSELFGEEPVPTPAETKPGDTTLIVDRNLFEENPFIALLRSTPGTHHRVSAPIENRQAIDRILAREDIQRLIPADSDFLWSSESFRIADKEYLGLYLVRKEAELTGRYLTDAQVQLGQDVQSSGMPEVNFRLNREGARIFSRVTGANIGKPLAIVLDGKVVTAPTIQSKIPTGSGRITGIGSFNEANTIAIVLRVGSLPTEVRIIEERTVGAALGQDSINAGKFSAIVGFGLVILFVIIYYKLSGLVASFALILNLVLLMAVLAQFRFTLTLPGIAGIVLTIGMAVDANVLVFERIREELRTGKTVRAAIEAGYGRAFLTIIDANLTTLLTALVLYQFGTGPIRGFAVTLSIGIVVSLFTALVVTRTIFDHITARRTLTRLSI